MQRKFWLPVVALENYNNRCSLVRSAGYYCYTLGGCQQLDMGQHLVVGTSAGGERLEGGKVMVQVDAWLEGGGQGDGAGGCMAGGGGAR